MFENAKMQNKQTQSIEIRKMYLIFHLISVIEIYETAENVLLHV